MGKNTREKLQKGTYSSHGITLIALVITIIILIILAGVAINLTVGENGIFNKAKYAKEQYQMAVVKEEIQLAIVDIQSGKLGNNEECTIDTIISELPSKLEGLTISKDGDIAKGTYNGYDFIIDEDLNVTIEGYNPSEGEDGTEGGEETTPTETTYTVTFNGTNVTSNGASTVKENETYTATLTAATGYEISTITVKMGESTLTKDTDYTYTDGVLSIPSVSGNIEITVLGKVKPLGASNYGQYVDYPVDIDGNEDDYDWQIFYTEEDPSSQYYGATYIIPDYYVPYTKMETSITNAEMSLDSGTYKVKWSNVAANFVKMSSYDKIKQIFMYDYTRETNPNVYAVSRLLYTDYWKDDFVTSQLQAKGGMAIGGPTINMWCASWNKKYPTEEVSASISGKGYVVNGYSSWHLEDGPGYKTDAPNMYFPTKDDDEDGTSGYWLAAPSSEGANYLMRVYCDGYLSHNSFGAYHIGLRPVIYLPPTVTLQSSQTPNLWNINYNN